MSMLVPIHQFEIRFTPIIDFATVSKEIIGPYIKLTTKFNIEFENTVDQRINLLFEPQGYSIHLYWDRIFLKTNLGFNGLTESNSIFVDPFLNIFNKLKLLDSFGKVNSFLFFTVVIKNEQDISFDKIVSDFKNKYFKEVVSEIMGETNDCAIVLEKKRNGFFYNTTFGPYKGIEDLKKRNVNIDFAKEEYNKFGLMMDLRISGDDQDISLKVYKELVEIANTLSNKL